MEFQVNVLLNRTLYNFISKIVTLKPVKYVF